jgi:hypothetical protein
MIYNDESIRRERVDEYLILASLRVARKGCGAVSNLQGRFEVNGRERFDGGWFDEAAESGDEPAAFKTVVTDEFAKTILSRNTSPDIPFSVSLNSYRGCEQAMYTSQRTSSSLCALS